MADTAYIALLRKERASDYGVDFPDFPGCVTAGRTLDEARRAAAEALALHVEGMLEDGEALPAPTRFDAVMADPENQDAVGFLVSLEAPESRAVRVNITLSRKVLARVDAEAKARGTSRSAFLVRAAEAQMAAPAGRRPTTKKAARRKAGQKQRA